MEDLQNSSLILDEYRLLMEEGVSDDEVAHMQEAARLSQPQRARLISFRAALLQDIDRITCERKVIMGSIKARLPHKLQQQCSAIFGNVQQHLCQCGTKSSS